MIENILLLVDNQISARQAAEYAAELARTYRSKVTVLHAYKPAPASSFGAYFLAIGSDKVSRKAKRTVDQVVVYLRQLGVEKVRGEARVGSPEKVLLEAADSMEPDVILVGSGKQVFSVRRSADQGELAESQYTLAPVLIV